MYDIQIREIAARYLKLDQVDGNNNEIHVNSSYRIKRKILKNDKNIQNSAKNKTYLRNKSYDDQSIVYKNFMYNPESLQIPSISENFILDKSICSKYQQSNDLKKTELYLKLYNIQPVNDLNNSENIKENELCKCSELLAVKFIYKFI